MANINCESCAEIREIDSNLLVNGWSNTECTSFKNDTGLSPSSGHNDCEDLSLLNDCLIGNMQSEIDAYEVCDWKDYIKKLVPNLWTVFSAVGCAICGLWTHMHALEESTSNMCDLISAQMRHPVKIFGMTPNLNIPAQTGGTIATKGGKPMLTPLARSEVSSDSAWLQQNVGFRYGVLKTKDCDGRCQSYEWIAPDLYAYRFNSQVTPAYDDMLWSIDKASVVGRMGMSQQMWAIREQNPLTWASDWTAGRALIALRLSVENDRLVLRYRGAIGATDASLSGMTISPPADQAERLYTFSC